MAELCSGRSLGEAWHEALACLSSSHSSAFDLLVTIAEPVPVEASNPYVAVLDELLLAHDWQDTATVASTIFPVGLWRTSGSRAQLYERYSRVYQGLRRASPKNSRGIYFERLIDYPLQVEPARSNQLETTILALQGARSPGGLYHAYELQIFCPGKDLRPRGFPCLSSLSAHVDGDRLRLSATYRNQYYIQKALGNFIGLARLQEFIARESGLKPGPLSVHAFHAQIDPELGTGELALLLESLGRVRKGAAHGSS